MSKAKTTSTAPDLSNTVLAECFSFETFREIGSYDKSNLISNNPSCFNGNVRITKLKITIEPVIEPIEVLAERLQKLWDECSNWHHHTPLENKARQLGYKLQGSAGNALKK